MNWIKNFVRPKIRSFLGVKRELPDNMWVKCSSCGELIYVKQLNDNLVDRIADRRGTGIGRATALAFARAGARVSPSPARPPKAVPTPAPVA